MKISVGLLFCASACLGDNLYVPAGIPAYSYAPYSAPSYVGSQFHAQDEFGNLNYGYSNLNSVKHEIGNTYGGVSGSYSYVDSNGALQSVNYVADGLGFRVADSRLPVAPVYDGVAPEFNPEPLVAPVFDGKAPEPVVDTPEVAEARAAHLALVEAAKSGERKRREADPAVLAGYSQILSAPKPLIHNPPVYPTYAALPYYTVLASQPTTERKRRDADPAILGGYSKILSAPTPLIHNAPVLRTYAALSHFGYPGVYGYPYAAHVF